jgi:hypothetical protein
VRDQLRTRDEGAIAIITAILAVLLVGLAAFATDFGQAYVAKRNLQKAADAAALSAAGKIIQLASPTDSCTDITTKWTNNTSGFQTAVTAAADSIATENSDLSNRTGMTVQCSSDNLRVEVSYANQGSVSSILGGIFGVSGISAARDARADVFAATSGLGLRPYAICSTDATLLVAASLTPQKWLAVKYPNDLCGNYGGNWYTLNCPEDNNNGTLDTTTLNGCKDEVGIIPQYDNGTPPAPLPPTTVNATIVTQCSAAINGTVLTPADCLTANPGNVAAQNVVDAWDTLLAKTAILVPIFDPAWNAYATSQVAKCGQGNNGCYPVKAFASVKVCGYLWGGNKNNYDVTTSGVGQICAGIAAAVSAAAKAKNGPTDMLWLALTTPLQTQGSTGPGGQGLGQTFGVYGTRLIK